MSLFNVEGRMDSIDKGSVLGISVAITDYETVVAEVRECALAADHVYLVEAANTHVVTLARHDRDFAKTMASFDLIVPDGMPLIWSLNRLSSIDKKMKDRVYGPTLMLECFEAFQGENEPGHFLLGGRLSTLNQLQANLAVKFPGAKVLGSYSPPFGKWPDDENERIAEMIRDSGASVIWVGLGCPKQENWMAEMKAKLPHGVYFGIGAAFAFHAGEVRQAPSLFQKFGLEWAYRLAMEPRRLFVRYLKYNSLFVAYSFWDSLRRKKT
jgi:N-acetylglucosaminyldiphosphoundecaprenol N-acetyl-beta-D-mannosaminyltransferase